MASPRAEPTKWSPGSWRRFEARQQPDYPDPAALDAACTDLAGRPALVDIDAIDALIKSLAEAQAGYAFVLQAGDCAERLSDGPQESRATAALVAELGEEIAAIGSSVVTIGRIAGQFAKPRSRPFETRGGATLPAWRGDSVNDMAFDAQGRMAQPRRLVDSYDHARETIRHIPPPPALYTSHEALLLPLEQSLVRHDRATARHFAASAHSIWIGARTLFKGSAHIELLRGLANPIGLKCGPELDGDVLLQSLDQLNPKRIPGRISLIVRLGLERIEKVLPRWLRSVGEAGHPVLWCCDPLHGNTMLDEGGRKRRRMADIEVEASSFFHILADENVYPGGLHLEVTSQAVSECLEDAAGGGGISDDECRDPRLNREQARRIAKLAADALAGRTASRPVALAAS